MAAALCFSLMVTQAGPMAYAAQPEAGQKQTLCEHHPEHDEACGYTEGSQGTPCTCIIPCARDAINVDCPVCGVGDVTATARFTVLPQSTSGEDEVLTITAPNFAPVYTGYTQPNPMPITITNSGDKDVIMTSLSKTAGATFTVQHTGTFNPIVPAGGSNTSFTVQLDVGWGVGDHTATITVGYGNGQTASTTVHFVVQPRPYDGNDSGSSSDSSGTWSVPAGTWVWNSVGWWYRKTDGTYPVSCWQKLAYGNAVEWYHFDERGYMQTGWHQVDGKWYYFREVQDSTEGALYKNTRTPDGYMVDENGVWKP